eukprot:350208-Chlamydomonas_euryale.AAC.20
MSASRTCNRLRTEQAAARTCNRLRTEQSVALTEGPATAQQAASACQIKPACVPDLLNPLRRSLPQPSPSLPSSTLS